MVVDYHYTRLYIILSFTFNPTSPCFLPLACYQLSEGIASFDDAAAIVVAPVVVVVQLLPMAILLLYYYYYSYFTSDGTQYHDATHFAAAAIAYGYNAKRIINTAAPFERTINSCSLLHWPTSGTRSSGEFLNESLSLPS